MSVQKFTSIPVEVEAIQWTGDNAPEISDFAGVNVDFEIGLSGRVPVIMTKEGYMTVSIGDYVVKEPFPTGDRDFYPFKKDIFEKRYRKP